MAWGEDGPDFSLWFCSVRCGGRVGRGGDGTLDCDLGARGEAGAGRHKGGSGLTGPSVQLTEEPGGLGVRGREGSVRSMASDCTWQEHATESSDSATHPDVLPETLGDLVQAEFVLVKRSGLQPTF